MSASFGQYPLPLPARVTYLCAHGNTHEVEGQAFMPTQTFNSFEAFFDSFRFANMRPMVLGPAGENWVLSTLVLNKLNIQWGQAEAKAVVEGAPRAGGISIFLPTRTPEAWWCNGRQCDDLSLMVDAPGADFCLATAAAPRSWCGLYIPNHALADASGDMTAAVGSKRGFFQVPRQRITRFRSVVAQLEAIAQRAPEVLESFAGRRAAEQKLLREVHSLLAVPNPVELAGGRPELPRRQIIRMAMDFVDQHHHECLTVEQLAAAAAVSERTLRDAFLRYFGVPPVQYLNRRALHQIRKALLIADPSAATVTEIATQFGVWQFGRMARDYRFLFGELPSETLRRHL
jgi:AraC family transcriptional regulator, ethanolamine operon transcriptional activator